MTTKFYLTRLDSTTPTSIYARIIYGDFRLKFYLNEKIHPKYWSTKTQKGRNPADFDPTALNERLDIIKKEIPNIILKYEKENGEYPLPEVLKEILTKKINHKNEEKKWTFMSYFEDFVERSINGTRLDRKTKKPVVYNTAKGFKSTLKHLQDFQKKYDRKINFLTIDYEFYDNYVEYLERILELSPNTIGDHIKRIKAVLEEATIKGLNTKTDFRNFVKPSEETYAIYLNETELEAIKNLDLSEIPRLDRARDMFLIGCYTGLRFSDFSRLPNEIIKNDKPKDFPYGYYGGVIQLKTGDPVAIPVHKVVHEIINKYNGKLPKAITNQNMNDYIKEVCKKVSLLQKSEIVSKTKGGKKKVNTFKRWELVSTHTARRSFASNNYLDGIPTLSIMAVTGHRTEKSFLCYIRITPLEHAKLLSLHWQNKDKAKVVAI